jgi:hypothetical protein
MNIPEQNQLKNILEASSADKFRETFGEWIALPRYSPGNEDFSWLEEISNPERTPKIQQFLAHLRGDVGKYIKSNKYEDAIKVCTTAFQEAKKQFDGDHIITLHRFIYARAGFVHEHRATHGDLSKLPLGSPKRTEYFLKAATCYMKSDLQLQYVTDYAGRVFESLGGAGEIYGEFAEKALTKLFGNDVMVIGPDDPGGQAIVKDLKNRSKDTKSGSTPHGGDVTFIRRDNLPPENSN